MSPFKVIPENVYEHGHDLESALEEYGATDLWLRFDEIQQELNSSAGKIAAKNNDTKRIIQEPLTSIGEALNILSSHGIKQNHSKDVMVAIQNSVRNSLLEGELIAFGYKLPRGENSKIIKIPLDIIKYGEINWEKSKIKDGNLEFVGVKIFSKEFLENENILPKIEKREKGRPTFKEEIKNVYLELKANNQIDFKNDKTDILRLISAEVAKRNNIKEKNNKNGFYKKLGYTAINSVIGKLIDKEKSAFTK